MALKTERLVNKLRSLGFVFKKQCDNTNLWRRGIDRVFVPRNVMVRESAVRAILQQCGCTEAEIEEFVRNAKA